MAKQTLLNWELKMTIKVLEEILKEIKEDVVIITTSGCSYIVLKKAFKFKQEYLEVASLKNYNDVGEMVFKNTYIDYNGIVSVEGITTEDIEL